MHASNLGRDKSEIGITFNSAIQGSLAPEPPARPEEQVDEALPHRPAFVEAVSETDALETLKILRDLHLEHLIVDQQRLPESHRGSIR